MYLISPEKNQYKANLQCHSVLSDGKLTPEQLKAAYKGQGYQVLAITDHETPRAHNEMSDPEFLMLTGYEVYIRDNPEGVYDVYASEVHLNLFARDPENETMICYNPWYCKYISQEEKDALKKVGSQRPREYNPAFINEFIRTAKENGYIVGYNHPVWSMESEENLLAYEGYFSIEMINYSSYTLNHTEYNGPLYDKLLCAGKRVFCNGSDDNHNKHPFGSPRNDSFGGFTMIMSDELKYDRIYEALETGEMYSSMGPVFKEVSFDGERLHVECSEVASIFVHYGSKSPASVYADPGETITSGDILLDQNCRYVRVSIVDREGKYADTRGYTREELGLPARER